MAKEVNATGDRIVLHVNVSKMLLDEESHDARVLKQVLSSHRISLEKAMSVLREHPIMYLDSLDLSGRSKQVKLVIRCCFDPPRWEQLHYLHP